MNYLKFIGLFVLTVSCNDNKNSCGLDMEDLLRNDKVFAPGFDSYQLLDKGKDSIIGGAYFFYKNRKLQSYKFFGSKNGYTYSEEYDLNGNLVHTIGKPIVYRNIKEVGKDSALITYYFFACNKLYFEPKISLNDSHKIDLRLEKDTLYSNMLNASISISTKGRSILNLYLEVSYLNHCTKTGILLKDTTTLSTYPYLDVRDQGEVF